MKTHTTIRFAFGLAVFCLVTVSAATNARAGNLSNAASNSINGVQVSETADSVDEFDGSPCSRFPEENVFDSFEKAFQTPEMVKCLNPNFAGDELNMKTLPAGFGKLVNLEVFQFGCLEELKTLPESISNLRKLEELIIDNGNGCTMNVALPRSIGKLENLRVLRLYGAFGSLPATLGNLRKLEVLDLARNGLKTVPAQIAGLTNIKTLRLEYNDLRLVPAFVGNFKNLKELSLDSNGRNVTLPASIAKFKGLKVSMGNNSLKLTAQKNLRARYPGIVFSFENEMDDSAANEEAAKPRNRRRQ